MLSIFDFNDYIDYLNAHKASLPKAGRGEMSRLSKLLKISNVAMSYIFKGTNQLNLDQALILAKDFALTELETDYLLTLVEHKRASTHTLKKYLEKKIVSLQDESQLLKNKVKTTGTIPETANAQFYSEWIYSGVRMVCDIPEYNSINEISDYLGISQDKVSEVVSFLLQHGLIIQHDSGLTVGPRVTHLGSQSPYINNHRKNWRIKALEKITEPEDIDLFYSAPMSISEEGALWLRKELQDLLERFTKKVSETNSEITCCLNLDFFRF